MAAVYLLVTFCAGCKEALTTIGIEAKICSYICTVCSTTTAIECGILTMV